MAAAVLRDVLTSKLYEPSMHVSYAVEGITREQIFPRAQAASGKMQQLTQEAKLKEI